MPGPITSVDTGGPGGFGGGFGGSEPSVPRPGRFFIPRVFLSSPDFGITLHIEVRTRTTIDEALDAGSYRVFYLSPLDVSDAAIALALNTAKLSRQFVGDVSGDGQKTLDVLYTPLGANGGRRDYSLGGWMYSVPVQHDGTTDDFNTSNLVRVPTFDRDTTPALNGITAASLNVTGPVVGIYTVTLNFVNPFPEFGRTQYCQLWMFNYFNDGRFRCLGIYRLHGAPGDVNGQNVTYKLESDGGGHNVTFYFAHCNGQRAMPFGKLISTYSNVIQLGGFP